MNVHPRDAIGEKPLPVEHSPRTRLLLHGPIVPTLLRMAWPNILVMLAQSATGLIETWFVSKLGTDALAGMALVFPCVMLMQMISAGAMGGGISSAVARALGAGRRDEADALVMHAIVINIALGLFFSTIMLAFGRPIYRALGGEGGELDAALSYSNVVFAGNVLLWVMNGLASVIRGTGNMLVPALVICIGVVVHDCGSEKCRVTEYFETDRSDDFLSVERDEKFWSDSGTPATGSLFAVSSRFTAPKSRGDPGLILPVPLFFALLSHAQQSDPQQVFSAFSGFVARTNAPMNFPSIWEANSAASSPVPIRKASASSAR